MRQKCLETVYNLAKKNKKVVFIGSDLGAGVLSEFKRKIPDRFFMEGVAEQAIIGLAAGLALEGYIPYVNTIATFITRRCFEQVAIDLCLHNLPVKLIGNGGGLVYAPLGPTHLAIEDIALMKSLPNMTIISPCDANEMKILMNQTINHKKPMYIRLGRGGEKIISDSIQNIKLGKASVFNNGQDVLIISTGTMTQKALIVAKNLLQFKIKTTNIHIHTIKPIDKETILKHSKKKKLIVTVEEHISAGGLGSSVLEILSDNFKHFPSLIRIGLETKFPKNYGTQDSLQDALGLSNRNIEKKILNYLK